MIHISKNRTSICIHKFRKPASLVILNGKLFSKYTVLATISILLFLSTIVLAQTATPTFKHFGSDDGLPSSQIYQALQDSKGYMWFATDRGVVKYNGYEFRTYSTDDGITDNVVFRMYEDYKERIWMISRSGNIFIYENNKISSFKYNSSISNLLKKSYQLEIAVDKSDNVHIGYAGGLFSISSQGAIKKNSLVEASTDDRLRYTICELNDINITIPIGPTSIGKTLKYFYHLKNEKTDSIFYNKQVNGRLAGIRLKNNSLLISLCNTLYELKNNTLVELFKIDDEIISVYQDIESHLWLCTTKGLYEFPKPGNFLEHNHYLADQYVSDIIQDKEKGFWITTIDDGVYYMVTNKINNYFTNKKNKVALSMTSDDSHVYASYFTGEIAKMNSSGYTEIIKSTSDKLISQIYYDHSSAKLYFSGDTMRYLKNNKIVTLNKNPPVSGPAGFAKNTNGLFSGHNWAIYKIESDSIIPVSRLNIRIIGIYTNNKNEILLASYDGAFNYDTTSNSAQLINPALAKIRVNAIASIERTMFFATQRNGLMCMQDDGNLIKIRTNDGLSSNFIYKMLVYKNTIWCSSNNGISKVEFSDVKNLKYKITNIGKNEGLPSNEINHIHIFKDTVWVASKKGISYFSSKESFRNEAPPLVNFTSFKVNNEDTTIRNNYIFPHDKNSISIGFEAPLFNSGAKQVYYFLLVNEEDSISGIRINREVEFLSLKPGSYKLFVKSKNNSGVWSKEAATLQFSILKPWWATNLFRFFLSLIIGGCIFIFYKYRINKIKEKYSIEKNQASLQLTAMRAQMNPHFIFNVMSSIRSYMQNNDNTSAEKYLTSFAKLVRYTLENSEVQEVTLEDELEAINNYVTLEMQRLEFGFDFEVYCADGIDPEETMLPSLLLQPFIENAIKHGLEHLNSKGKIRLEVKKVGNEIMIAIEDNGIGRAKAGDWNEANRGKHHSFGSKLTFERISAFNKAFNKNIRVRLVDFSDKEKDVQGTRVELFI